MGSFSPAAILDHPYAPRGLYGLMVPYGNFATEWEMSVLLPKPEFFITTRLTDGGGDLNERLRSYFSLPRLEQAVASFGTTPLRAIGIACSATSYFIGKQQEEALFQHLSDRHRTPFISATAAMQSGLDAIGARRITLVSPYPTAITEHCLRYWTELGYRIDDVCQLDNPRPGFHPIYTLTPAQVEHAFLDALRHARSPVLVTGTGLSSLPLIRKAFRTLGADAPPTLSATLCLARSLRGDAAADIWFTPQASWMNADALMSFDSPSLFSD